MIFLVLRAVSMVIDCLATRRSARNCEPPQSKQACRGWVRTDVDKATITDDDKDLIVSHLKCCSDSALLGSAGL